MIDKIKRERGRPEKLTASFKEFIAKCKENNPSLSAQKIRGKLAQALHKALEVKHPVWSQKDIDDRVATFLPGLSRIQKYLTKDVNPHKNKPSPLDNPWYLGLLSKINNPGDPAKYKIDIPQVAVPHLLLVQNWLEQHPDLVFKRPQELLTIREAQWISRLHGIVNIHSLKKKTRPEAARWLYVWAEAYATRERICEKAKTPFDTSRLDEALRKGAQPVTIGETIIYHFGDEIEIDTLDERLLQQMEEMKKDGEE
ncbi:hypothetical protein ACFLX7_02960 [Chloroflexota bacterium]